MKRELPSVLSSGMEEQPCSVVALCNALDDLKIEQPFDVKTDRYDYATIKDMNTAIRSVLTVRYTWCKKSFRETLEKKFQSGIFRGKKAIVLVQNHFIYVNNDTYYSFFDNAKDEVIAFWFIKE